MYEYNLVTNSMEVTITSTNTLVEIVKIIDNANNDFVILKDGHGSQYALRVKEIIMIEEIKNER